MGFSTSGAVAIVFVGVLVASSVFVPTLFDIGSATGDAFSSQVDAVRDASNTDVSIQEVERNESAGTVTVAVANNGTDTLEITKTNVLVNGELIPLAETETTVTNATDPSADPIAETKLWPPSTELEIEIDESTLATTTENRVQGVDEVDRVLIVTESGIKDGTSEIGDAEET